MEQIETFIETRLHINIEYSNENKKYKSINWMNLNKLDIGKQVLFSKLIIPWIRIYNPDDEFEKCLLDYYLIKLGPMCEDKYTYNSNIRLIENILFNHDFKFSEDIKKIICIIYEMLNIV